VAAAAAAAAGTAAGGARGLTRSVGASIPKRSARYCRPKLAGLAGLAAAAAALAEGPLPPGRLCACAWWCGGGAP
jgi:hypothetical protein